MSLKVLLFLLSLIKNKKQKLKKNNKIIYSNDLFRFFLFFLFGFVQKSFHFKILKWTCFNLTKVRQNFQVKFRQTFSSCRERLFFFFSMFEGNKFSENCLICRNRIFFPYESIGLLKFIFRGWGWGGWGIKLNPKALR